METHARTLIKTLSYRVMAGSITAAIAGCLTGNWNIGVTLGVADTLAKLGLFYVHERAWLRIRTERAPAHRPSGMLERANVRTLNSASNPRARRRDRSRIPERSQTRPR